jgi:hypothetical protein
MLSLHELHRKSVASSIYGNLSEMSLSSNLRDSVVSALLV